MILPSHLAALQDYEIKIMDFKSDISLIHLKTSHLIHFQTVRLAKISLRENEPVLALLPTGFVKSWLCKDLNICRSFTFSIKLHLVVLACFLRLYSPAANHPTSCWNCCNAVNPQPLKKRPPHAVSLHRLTIRAKFLPAWDFPWIKYTHTHLKCFKNRFPKIDVSQFFRRLSQRPTAEELEQRNILKRKFSLNTGRKFRR